MTSSNGRIPLSLEGIEKALARSKEGHRREYLDSLRKRVAVYEERYRMPSDVLLEALAYNKIKENADIVKWAHAHESLVRLERGQSRTQTRLERTR